jgi:hypothetical protein
MRKFYALMCALTLTIIFGSCSSNDETETAIDENLPAISEKLESLEISSLTEEDSNLFKETPKKKPTLAKNYLLEKEIQNKQSVECQHEVIAEDYSTNEEFYKITERYFTIDGNEATNCDIENLYAEKENNTFNIQYIIEQDIIEMFEGYDFKIFSRIKNEESLTMNSPTSMSYRLNNEADLTGTLSFDDNLFSLLEGSRVTLSSEVNVNPDDDIEEIFYEVPFSTNFKFIMGFESNQSHYYFHMLLDDEDMMTAYENENDFVEEYDLFNSKDEKIGTIRYVLDSSEGTEKFILYDLEGNLVA